ncbi:MAG: radical SAM protein [Thermoplasmata archaeon]
MMEKKIAYGPVPSRRLGQSLGINNIPPKICTYSCIYCQLGRTIDMRADREEFYSFDEILESVQEKVDNAVENHETIDYLTFVPDGEPTLDVNLGEEIEAAKELGYKVAVISNSSLIWDKQVREDLYGADRVSLKVDAVSPDVWKKVNRPHKKIDMDEMMTGMYEFVDSFSGEVDTETMLVEGVNDDTEELKKTADKILDIRVDGSYIAIPTRPPAEDWANPPAESKITEAYHIFSERGLDTEYLIGYEGDAFASSGDVKEDLLSITSVHPMRERQVDKLLSKSNSGWDAVQKLLDDGLLTETEYEGEKFYMRKLD